MLESIIVKGACENNLKNLDVTIPRNKLVVFTGVSGSGKSSLAFGTIFAEGQRRFMESLSSYARQFLGQIQKPAVEYIEGLSPSISIDQKTTSHNPRSTVGTVTEIYDYLRLLYARVGEPYCPKCGKKITRQSVDQIVEQIFQNYFERGGTAAGVADRSPNEATADGPTNIISIEAPVVRGQKGSFAKELDSYKRSGFIRVKIDGSIYSLGEQIDLDKNIRHDINIIIDKITVAEDERTRINEAIESALRLTDGIVLVEDKLFSNKFACIDCGINIEELEPRVFSFNSPFGACQNCGGLGFTMEIDESQVIPNKDLTLAEGAIVASGWNIDGKIAPMYFRAFAKQFGISLAHKVKDIAPDIVHKLLYGCDEKLRYQWSGENYDNNYLGRYEGIIPNLKRRYKETNSEWMKQEIAKLMVNATCPVCLGRRLRSEALAVKVGGINIYELTSKPIKNVLDFFDKLSLTKTKAQTAEQIIKEVRARCQFLVDVGLHYLTLARGSDSLSGGESQRIRLATQIGSGLVGVLYILDEPSIGLHQRDNHKLLGTLTRLRDLGNTLIVVEHDEDTIRSADFIVDIGPKAGVHGGELVVAGTIDDVKRCEASITGAFLRGERKITAPAKYRLVSLKDEGEAIRANPFKVIKATKKDLPAITKLTDKAQVMLVSDIENGDSYISVKGAKIVGYGVLKFKKEVAYDKIYKGKWGSDEPYAVIKHIAGEGGAFLIKHFENLCVMHDTSWIRADANAKNLAYIKLLAESGFKKVGSIYYDPKTERTAFEKQFTRSTLTPQNDRSGFYISDNSANNGRYIEIVGARENNLKNIDVKIPMGVLTAVTGVSGSGKSSLVNRILYPALSNALHRSNLPVGKHTEIFGAKYFDKVIEINQSPIGRTPRSNPATYTGVFTAIRELFAGTPGARERGYEAGRFSFNVRGGRCDECDGDGIKKIEMHFLPDVFVQCEVCKGKRFNKETLEVKFKGKNIYDVLDMTVDEACEFFQNIPGIFKKIKTMQDVGLGYIKLGQSATTLSGGEAQRVKLATELSRTATGRTIYVLDEPTTGLHSYDVEKLINILQRLVNTGNTVIVIEHNLDVIKVADYIIDLGPEGGDEGGQVVATGNPREIAKNPKSTTGEYLSKILN